MSKGFVGRMQEAMIGYTVWADADDTDCYQLVWVQPLVPGEPEPGEVWENHGGRHLTITSPPYTNHWSGARIVPTDGGNYLLEHLRPIPVHPWHRRADGSAEGRDKDQRVLRDRRSGWTTTHFFIERGKCDRKGERRQNDE